MTSMAFMVRRRRALAMMLAGALVLTAGAAVASANNVPHPELRVNLFVPPATMPADTPFWIGQGFATDASQGEVPADGAPGFASFELYVDGSAVPLRKDVEFAGGAAAPTVGIVWYHNFATGLAGGTHHFEGRWVAAGSLILQLEADVLFA